MYNMPAIYEWDEAKRQDNRAKHGVDFTDMEDFEWVTAVVDADDSPDEPRWVAKGFIGQTLHFVVFTERGSNIRVISLRKATRQEAQEYVKHHA